MTKATLFSQYYRVRIMLFLAGCFIFCGLYSTSTAEEPNDFPVDDPVVMFSEAVRTKSKCSEALKELCDKTDLGTIHTFRYYKKVRQIVGFAEPDEIIRAKRLLRGFSDIAWRAIQDEFDSQERIAILEQLVRLEKSILKVIPVGAGNVELANEVSMLISGFIFQEVAGCQISELDKIVPFAQRKILDNYFNKGVLKRLLELEIEYHPSLESKSQYDLLINMVKEKCPVLLREYKDMNSIDIDTLAKLSLFSHKPKKHKSRNPLIDIDPLKFVSDFLIVRNAELLARTSLTCRKSSEDHDDKLKSHLEFKMKFISDMSEFEKLMFGNPLTEQEINKMVSDVRLLIEENLSTKGKRIFEIVYRRGLLLSEDSDIEVE